MKRTSQSLRMNACPRCGGAAYLDNPDEEEWRCLQCGRTVPLPVEAGKKQPVRAA